MRNFETLLSRLHPSDNLAGQEQKMSSQHLVTKSHFGLVKRRNVRSMCNVRIWKVAFSSWTTSHFWLFKRQKRSSQSLANNWNIASSTSQIHILGWWRAENVLKVTCELLKHRYNNSSNSHFGLVKRKETSSKCHSTSWNIDFSNSAKSHFRLVKREKNCSQFLATTWKIDLSKSPKWHLR